jgi:hypothetical protein
MVKWIKRLLFVFLAFLLALGVAFLRIKDTDNSTAFFKNGVWQGTTNLPLGKDPLITTQVALFALFALPSEEAVYLFARKDNLGNKLDGTKDYTITGNIHQLQANYWSITAYGKDLYLIPNEANRFGFSKSTIVTDSAGNFTIQISATAKEGNWLPAPAASPFGLLLRIYQGEKGFMEKLSSTPLPELKMTKP